MEVKCKLLRVRPSGRLFWSRKWTSEFHKRLEIHWLLACQGFFLHTGNWKYGQWEQTESVSVLLFTRSSANEIHFSELLLSRDLSLSDLNTVTQLNLKKGRTLSTVAQWMSLRFETSQTLTRGFCGNFRIKPHVLEQWRTRSELVFDVTAC
jgi:hypothetical protein